MLAVVRLTFAPFIASSGGEPRGLSWSNAGLAHPRLGGEGPYCAFWHEGALDRV